MEAKKGTGWDSASRSRSRHGAGISNGTEAGMVRAGLEFSQRRVRQE